MTATVEVAPTAEMTATAAVMSSAMVSPEQVSFDDQGLTQQAARVQMRAASAAGSANAPGPGAGEPESLRFSFREDTVDDAVSPLQRQMLIYSVAAYQDLLKSEGIADDANPINQLTELLSNRPATVSGTLPLLPQVPGSQTFNAGLKYLDFKSGSGVRYISRLSFDVSPISNANIFYTFQGLTSDGKYYVTFFSPLKTNALPTDSTMTAAESDALAKNYDTYVRETADKLGALASTEFTPDLAKLDALIESLNINSNPSAAQSSQAQAGAGLANPASVNCATQGGTLTIEKNGAGGEFGVCMFEDNRQCEEWALFRAECPVGGLKVTGFVTPASRFCAITGGDYKVTSASNDPNEQGTCTFKDGKTCDAADYFNGKCSR